MVAQPELSKSEWVVMNAMWSHSGRDGLTLAEFYEALGSTKWVIGTVRSFLTRLVKKGYVKTSPCPYGNRYKPAVARTAVVRRAVKEFVRVALTEDVEPLIYYLCRESEIPKKDVKSLEKHLKR